MEAYNTLFLLLFLVIIVANIDSAELYTMIALRRLSHRYISDINKDIEDGITHTVRRKKCLINPKEKLN